jgi:hypothetical protein
MAQLTLPQLTRGIRSRCRYPLLVSCMEKAVTVSLPLISIFPLTIPIFSHSNFFRLNRSSVGRAGCPPSVNKGITGPIAVIPACDSPADGNGCEFSPPFYFSPHHSDFFSQLLFSH